MIYSVCQWNATTHMSFEHVVMKVPNKSPGSYVRPQAFAILQYSVGRLSDGSFCFTNRFPMWPQVWASVIMKHGTCRMCQGRPCVRESEVGPIRFFRLLATVGLFTVTIPVVRKAIHRYSWFFCFNSSSPINFLCRESEFKVNDTTRLTCTFHPCLASVIEKSLIPPRF